jgi:hypothetical protein
VRRHRRSWWGPCGALLLPWTFALVMEAVAALALARWRGGRETGSGLAIDAPLGRRAAAPSRFPHGFPSLHRYRAPAGGLIAAGCGCGCSIALAPPQGAAGWWCAARPCGGHGSCTGGPWRGGGVWV